MTIGPCGPRARLVTAVRKSLSEGVGFVPAAATGAVSVAARMSLALSLAATGLVAPASAQELRCSCTAAAGVSAAVIGVQRRVFRSTTSGFEPAGEGSQIGPGGRVMVGPGSAANLSLGVGCQLRLGENSEAAVLIMASGQTRRGRRRTARRQGVGGSALGLFWWERAAIAVAVEDDQPVSP